MSQASNYQIFDGTYETLGIKLKDRRSLTVLMLTSPTCVVCKRAKMILPTICNENPDVQFLEAGYTDSTKSIFQHFSVQNVPQFFFFKGTELNGEPKMVTNLIGFDAKEVRLKITQFI